MYVCGKRREGKLQMKTINRRNRIYARTSLALELNYDDLFCLMDLEQHSQFGLNTFLMLNKMNDEKYNAQTHTHTQPHNHILSGSHHTHSPGKIPELVPYTTFAKMKADNFPFYACKC